MKTTFTLQQVKQLLALTPEQQRQVVDYGDTLAAASDDEIINSSVAADANEMIRDLHRRSVRRARAAVARRKRRTRSPPVDKESSMYSIVKSRLDWFRLKGLFNNNVDSPAVNIYY